MSENLDYLQGVMNLASILRSSNNALPTQQLRNFIEQKILKLDKSLEFYNVEKEEIPDEINSLSISNKIFLKGNYVPGFANISGNKKMPNIKNIICIYTNIHGIQFYKRILSQAAFINSVNTNSIPVPLLLQESSLYDVLFYGNDLRGSFAYRVKLYNVKFHNCNINNMQFKEYEIVQNGFFEISFSHGLKQETPSVQCCALLAKRSDSSRHIFKEVIFKKCLFKNINTVDITNVVFDSCKFDSCKLEPSEVIGNSADRSTRQHQFTNCKFVGEEISSNLLDHNRVDLSNSKFVASQGKKFTFFNIDFSKCTFLKTEFTDCKFTNCIFPSFCSAEDQDDLNLLFKKCEFKNIMFLAENIDSEKTEFDTMHKRIKMEFTDCSMNEIPAESKFTFASFSNTDFSSIKGENTEDLKPHVFYNCKISNCGILRDSGDYLMESTDLKKVEFIGRNRSEWRLSFDFCRINDCLYKNINFNKKGSENLANFVNVRFDEETTFDKCEFNFMEYYKCKIKQLKIVDCHERNNLGIKIEKSAIYQLIVDKHVKSENPLRIGFLKVNMFDDWKSHLQHYAKTVGLDGTVWAGDEVKSKTILNLNITSDAFPMDGWGISLKTRVQKLYNLCERFPIQELRHPDLVIKAFDDLEKDPDDLVSKNRFTDWQNALGAMVNEKDEMRDLLSKHSFVHYEEHADFLLKNFEGALIDTSSERGKNLLHRYYYWRSSFVKRYSQEDNLSYKNDLIPNWIKSLGFEIGENYWEQGGGLKVYLDYHTFQSIIEPISVNIKKHTKDLISPEVAITRKKGETFFTIKLFDRGAGFTSKENYIKWKESKLTELQTFTKAWCGPSFMYTKISGKYNQLNLLNKYESMKDIVDEVWLDKNNIGTAFVFNIKLADSSSRTTTKPKFER